MRFTKKILTIAIALMLVVIAMPAVVIANDAIAVTVDGQAITFTDQNPVIVDGRTLVPVRGVFEAMGFDVGWNSDTRTATLTRTGYVVVITLDSDVFTTNDISHNLDVPAQIIGSSTMLPIRPVLESVGYSLNWDGATRTVVITSPVVVELNEEHAMPTDEPTVPIVAPTDPATAEVELSEFLSGMDIDLIEYVLGGEFTVHPGPSPVWRTLLTDNPPVIDINDFNQTGALSARTGDILLGKTSIPEFGINRYSLMIDVGCLHEILEVVGLEHPVAVRQMWSKNGTPPIGTRAYHVFFSADLYTDEVINITHFLDTVGYEVVYDILGADFTFENEIGDGLGFSSMSLTFDESLDVTNFEFNSMGPITNIQTQTGDVFIEAIRTRGGMLQGTPDVIIMYIDIGSMFEVFPPNRYTHDSAITADTRAFHIIQIFGEPLDWMQ